MTPSLLAAVTDVITGDLTDWVVGVIDAIGAAGVALLVALESVFPPIPSEVVLPAAGFAAADGSANLLAMVVAATIGSLLGAWVLYLIAAAVGERRLRIFVLRRGRWFGVRLRDLERAESWFDDHSGTAVLICRCVPLIRSLVSVPAGFRRMDPFRFTVFTVLGSLVWNTVLIGGGFALGDNWEEVTGYVGVLQYVVAALLLPALAWWVWTRFISSAHRGRRRTEDAADRRALARELALEAEG